VSDPRRFRNDNRTRHDGKTSNPAPVIHLDPQTMQPKRTNVTAADNAAAIKAAASLSWKEQAAEQERLASMLLAKLRAEIEAGAYDRDVLERLAKLTTMTKQFLVEGRQSGETVDYDKLPVDQLAAAAAKAPA
jgi:hypothetical protein